jgi:hypothetical protein
LRTPLWRNRSPALSLSLAQSQPPPFAAAWPPETIRAKPNQTKQQSNIRKDQARQPNLRPAQPDQHCKKQSARQPSQLQIGPRPAASASAIKAIKRNRPGPNQATTPARPVARRPPPAGSRPWSAPSSPGPNVANCRTGARCPPRSCRPIAATRTWDKISVGGGARRKVSSGRRD